MGGGGVAVGDIFKLPGAWAVALIGLPQIDSMAGAEMIFGFDLTQLIGSEFGVSIGGNLDAGIVDPELSLRSVGWPALGEGKGAGEEFFVAGGHHALVGVFFVDDLAVEAGDDRAYHRSAQLRVVERIAKVLSQGERDQREHLSILSGTFGWPPRRLA